MSGYFVEPLDVLFFRDSRPFAAGESFHARTTPLPMPSVLYGALRSRLLEERGFDFARLRSREPGEAEQVIQEAIGAVWHKGPFLARRDGAETVAPLLPAPLDVVRGKDGVRRRGRMLRLRPCEALKGQWSAPLEGMCPLLPPPEEVDPVEAAGPFITRDGARTWLSGGEEFEARQFCRADELVRREHRFGIGMYERTGTQDGERFFAAEFLRFERDAGLAGELDCQGARLPGNGSLEGQILTFGGERRSGVVYGTAFPPELTSVPAMTGNRLKLWLVTPGLFRHGWLPGEGEPGSRERTIHGVRLNLIAAAVGKPVPVSGWDMARGRPKPVRRAAPAGSVASIGRSHRTSRCRRCRRFRGGRWW